MIKSNLINVLRSFSKKECRELRKWLLSPAHNQREDVLKLFDYLMEDRHLYKDEFLSKETAYPWVFQKGEAFNDAKIRQTMFFFMNTVEEFLVYQELLQDEVRAKRTLASVYRKRKLDKTFKKTIKNAFGMQEKYDYRNSTYLRNEYLLEQEKFAYSSEYNRMGSLNLQEVSNTLDVTYLADKLAQICSMLSHQRVFKTEYKIGLLDPVLKSVESGSYLENPAIACYYYGYKTMTDRDNSQHFYNLKKEIVDNGHLFPKTELRYLYLMATNYATGKANAGKESFKRELFELFREGLKKDILIENGILNHMTFKNIVSIGAPLGEYEYLEKFIEEYQHFIVEKYRNSLVNFCKAMLAFVRGEYDQAQVLLNKYKYSDVLMDLNAKTILLKIYYEQDEIDILEHLLESMETFLRRREEISPNYKTNYQNVVHFTKKLLKIHNYTDKNKLQLQKDIEDAKLLSERQWLLKQLAAVSI